MCLFCSLSWLQAFPPSNDLRLCTLLQWHVLSPSTLFFCSLEGKHTESRQAKKKAHKHKLFCPVGLGTNPGLSQGYHRACPWDKSGENLGQTRVFSLFYTVEARFHRVCPFLGQTGFVPGTIPGTKGGTESLCEKSLCAFFAR